MTPQNPSKPKRIAWLTDLHLEFVSSYSQIQKLCKTISIEKPDAILVGGDTGNANSFSDFLQDLEHLLRTDIYFVLGNHDFYGSSIDQVRAKAERVSNESKRIRWLTNSGIVELTPNTALVGHDGWADGRLGRSERSPIDLNDYRLIEDFKNFNRKARFEKLAQLGDEAATRASAVLSQAFLKYRNVIFLTHVPPFREACWHEGRISDDDFLPHFACRAMGEAMTEVMKKNLDKKLTVLCGHTHGNGYAEILPNLMVKTGGAEYGFPKIQEVLETL